MNNNYEIHASDPYRYVNDIKNLTLKMKNETEHQNLKTNQKE